MYEKRSETRSRSRGISGQLETLFTLKFSRDHVMFKIFDSENVSESLNIFFFWIWEIKMDKQKHKQYRKAQFCLEVVIISSRVSVKTTRLHHCLGTVKRLNSFFTSSSGSIWKASFCLHEFCWQWKLPTSIVNIWVFIYFFFTDMLTKVCESSPKNAGPSRWRAETNPW